MLARNKNKKLRISIKFGISSAFIAVIILTSAAICASVLITVRQVMRNDLEMQIHDIVSIGSLLLNGDEHMRLVDKSQGRSEEYIKMKKMLKEIRSKATGIRYVYTMRMEVNGNYVFVVDAEDDPENDSHIGDVYTSPTDTMKEAFRHPDRVHIEKEFATDEWGTWISGYAPIFTSDHKLAGILGVDVSAQKVIEYERKYMLIIFGITLITCILVVILAIVISTRITHPLYLLKDDIEKIQGLELGSDTYFETVFKEIISMENAVDNMKKGLRSFSKYVPADLVTQLISVSKEAVLSGEKKAMTVFFSDIADFATISERTETEELLKNLAVYFSGMTTTIHENKGTIDKYMGDAIMAFWGAPNDMDNQAFYACQSALLCLKFLEDFNSEMERCGSPKFNTRMGINTGEVIVGNIGYEKRLNYTVIGDNVNLASRIEDLNKNYGTNIIISESTYNEVRDKVLARKLDYVIVKGKTKGIYIYELICLNGSESPMQQEMVDIYNRAVELYLNKKWEEAQRLFEKVLEVKQEDKPTKIMIKRCREYMNSPS